MLRAFDIRVGSQELVSDIVRAELDGSIFGLERWIIPMAITDTPSASVIGNAVICCLIPFALIASGGDGELGLCRASLNLMGIEANMTVVIDELFHGGSLFGIGKIKPAFFQLLLHLSKILGVVGML